MYKIITFFPLMQGIAIKVEKNRAKTQTFAPFLTQYIMNYNKRFSLFSVNLLAQIAKHKF